MKIINKSNLLLLLLTLWGLGSLTSCEKDEIRAIMKSNPVPVVGLSAQNIVLTKENADKDALVVSWPKPDYGFDAAVSYTVLLDKKGGDFKNATAFSTGSELKKTFKTNELNNILLKMGYKVGTPADIDVKVTSLLGEKTVFSSVLGSFKATPYLDKLDLSSNWGVVGSATTNGWNGPDMPFYKTSDAGVFVAYVTLADGEIKFRQDNKWDVNYGDDGANGSAEKNGANIAVKAGTYRILFNTNTFRYTIDKYSWGVVGSAINDWGAKPDGPFFYDPSSDQWRAIVKLTNGEIKIRQNSDWAVNYGGKDGVLVPGGDNIKVSAGTYLITVDFKTLKYTIEAFKVWGIVGSATANGWNGPDSKFTPDFGAEGVWYLNGVKLVDGEVKFRQNDDWAVNYGDDGANGSLELNGANIAVKAGTYDVMLDFSVAGKPTYKLTKK
ncbi:MAG: SusE domain-containing protein [Spirosomataceae bacterium]